MLKRFLVYSALVSVCMFSAAVFSADSYAQSCPKVLAAASGKAELGNIFRSRVSSVYTDLADKIAKDENFDKTYKALISKEIKNSSDSKIVMGYESFIKIYMDFESVREKLQKEEENVLFSQKRSEADYAKIEAPKYLEAHALIMFTITEYEKELKKRGLKSNYVRK